MSSFIQTITIRTCVMSLLLALLLIFTSGLVQGADDVIYEDEHELAVQDGSSRYKRAMDGVNMCFCCASQQISMCCQACIKRKQDGLDGIIGSNEMTRDNVGYAVLSRRLSFLRMSACSCCAQTPNKASRCCNWCGNMGRY